MLHKIFKRFTNVGTLSEMSSAVNGAALLTVASIVVVVSLKKKM